MILRLLFKRLYLSGREIVDASTGIGPVLEKNQVVFKERPHPSDPEGKEINVMMHA
jgi:hypothetical protein